MSNGARRTTSIYLGATCVLVVRQFERRRRTARRVVAATEALIEGEMRGLIEKAVAGTVARLGHESAGRHRGLDTAKALLRRTVVERTRIRSPAISSTCIGIELVLQLGEGLLRDITIVAIVGVGSLTKVFDSGLGNVRAV